MASNSGNILKKVLVVAMKKLFVILGILAAIAAVTVVAINKISHHGEFEA